MATERECLEALRAAAAELGASPTKAEYEELGLTPASATIVRTCGGWNAAKELAGLATFEQGGDGGPGVAPKPESVTLAADETWDELTSHQRWYRKNRERQADKKQRRRARLRRWLHDYKRRECACARCGEGHPACLDFHHVGEKRLGVAEMVARGFSKRNIRAEITQCTVLCANCHRKEHYTAPDA